MDSSTIFHSDFPSVRSLTIRLPEDKHARLRQLAKHRDMSENKHVEEFATISIAEFDAGSRFHTLAVRASRQKCLATRTMFDAVFAATE